MFIYSLIFPFLLLSPARSYFIGPDKLYQADAATYCISQGSTLASMHSDSDFATLQQLCTDQQSSGAGACWIGLKFDGSTSSWSWLDGTALDYGFSSGGSPTGGVKPWAQGEPNNSGGQEECVEISPGANPAYYLNDAGCLILFYPLCNGSPATPTPTANPTFKNCENDGEIKKVNWFELQNANDNSGEVPANSVSITLDESRLELTFVIDLEYIGSSSNGDWDKAYDLPTTYVIDFQSFETNGDAINEPGNCQNRLSSSFDGITDFNQFWGYSEYPYLSGNLGSTSYLSYPPPSEWWMLNIGEDSCTPINYHGTFSWNDLSQCTDFDGTSLIDVVDDGTSITLSGTLYINIVSPYSISASPATDTGFYRVFTLVQQDFQISINKQINILSSTGIDLFITSIIGVYEDETDGSFQLSVLTQSADYIQLTNPVMVSSPYGTDSSSISITQTTSSCLVSSSFTCGQIFTISIDQSVIQCPPASFVGDYEIGFTVNCPSTDDADICDAFIDDNGGSSVALSVSSNFIDNNCQAEIYNVIFDGSLTFYDDSTFETVHDESAGNYVIGQDDIYIQVLANFPDDGSGDNLNIFAVEIDNVFVCTAADAVDLSINLDQQSGNGGCLSSNIDADGPYNIITNGVGNSLYSAQILDSTGLDSNILRFSFKAFDIGRSKMYIHAQITLLLQNGNRRRLQVLTSDLSGDKGNADSSNQIRHFMDSVSVDYPTTMTTTTASDLGQEGEGGGDENKCVRMQISYSILILSVFILFLCL